MSTRLVVGISEARDPETYHELHHEGRFLKLGLTWGGLGSGDDYLGFPAVTLTAIEEVSDLRSLYRVQLDMASARWSKARDQALRDYGILLPCLRILLVPSEND
jgi:hypothetical protein